MTHQWTRILFRSLILLGAGVISLSAHAVPLIWETDFGTELAALSGQDDAEQHVALSFSFNFFGIDYTHLYVGVNGLISLHPDAGLPYNPRGALDLLNASAPLIAPFWSDLDLTQKGQVFFNDLGDRAVLTWSEAGSFKSPLASFTFQVQLTADGRIILGYNGVADIVSHLDEDLVTGVGWGKGLLNARRVNYTDGVLYRPALSDRAYQFTMEGTLYEVFSEGAGVFDLDDGNLVFTPFLGQAVARGPAFNPPPPPPSPPPSPAAIPEPGSLVLMGIGLLGMFAYGWRRRKNPSPGPSPTRRGEQTPPSGVRF